MSRIDRLKRFAWIAVLAVAALALGPTVSRAVRWADGPATASHPHCEGMDGAHPTARDGRSGDADPLSGCELCAVAAAPALRTADGALALASTPSGRDAEPPAPAAVWPRPTWPPSAPRGPPSRI